MNDTPRFIPTYCVYDKVVHFRVEMRSFMMILWFLNAFENSRNPLEIRKSQTYLCGNAPRIKYWDIVFTKEHVNSKTSY